MRLYSQQGILTIAHALETSQLGAAVGGRPALQVVRCRPGLQPLSPAGPSTAGSS